MPSHWKAQGEFSIAPSEQFTGEVVIKRLGKASDQGASVDIVTFGASARTGWHSHPAGQSLYVVEGEAVIVNEEGHAIIANPGDVVHTSPDEKHWHGAFGSGAMIHISITTSGAPDWQGFVSDEEATEAIRKR